MNCARAGFGAVAGHLLAEWMADGKDPYGMSQDEKNRIAGTSSLTVAMINFMTGADAEDISAAANAATNAIVNNYFFTPESEKAYERAKSACDPNKPDSQACVDKRRLESEYFKNELNAKEMLQSCQKDLDKCLSESQKTIEDQMSMNNCSTQPTKPDCVSMEAYRKAMWSITASGKIDDMSAEILTLALAGLSYTTQGALKLGKVGVEAVRAGAISLGFGSVFGSSSSDLDLFISGVTGGVYGHYRTVTGLPDVKVFFGALNPSANIPLASAFIFATQTMRQTLITQTIKIGVNSYGVPVFQFPATGLNGGGGTVLPPLVIPSPSLPPLELPKF